MTTLNSPDFTCPGLSNPASACSQLAIIVLFLLILVFLEVALLVLTPLLCLDSPAFSSPSSACSDWASLALIALPGLVLVKIVLLSPVLALLVLTEATPVSLFLAGLDPYLHVLTGRVLSASPG